METMKSSNAKQKDRVASYARRGLEDNQKTAYRARGCRGGTSRKPSANRKKTSSNGDVHNEENDPSRLNSSQRCQFPTSSMTTNDSTELTYQKHSELVNTSTKSSSKAKTTSKPRKRRSRRCSAKSNDDENKPDGNPKGLSLSILPNNGPGLTDDVDSVEVELSNPILPILPGTTADHAAAAEMESKAAKRPAAGSPRKFSSIIGRPSSPISRTANNGGFTFFSISPRSFLGGKRRGVPSPKKR